MSECAQVSRPDPEICKALDESFRAALVLTGSIEAAEHAVTDALSALGSNLSARALLVETARSAFQRSALAGESSPVLPPYLQALFRLSPTQRYSFVLRLFVGLDRGTCCQILRLSGDEAEEALWKSLVDLPQAIESSRCASIASSPGNSVEFGAGGSLTDLCTGSR
jgi:hypothetical protein